MARTTDWVEEQSSQDQPSTPENVAPCAQPVTPPQRNLNCEDQNGDTKLQSAAPAITKCNSKLVYSIPALLSMRHLQGAVPVMLRVRPEAIAGKLHDTGIGGFRITRHLLLTFCREHLPVHGCRHYTSPPLSLPRSFRYVKRFPRKHGLQQFRSRCINWIKVHEHSQIESSSPPSHWYTPSTTAPRRLRALSSAACLPSTS